MRSTTSSTRPAVSETTTSRVVRVPACAGPRSRAGSTGRPVGELLLARLAQLEHDDPRAVAEQARAGEDAHGGLDLVGAERVQWVGHYASFAIVCLSCE